MTPPTPFNPQDQWPLTPSPNLIGADLDRAGKLWEQFRDLPQLQRFQFLQQLEREAATDYAAHNIFSAIMAMRRDFLRTAGATPERLHLTDVPSLPYFALHFLLPRADRELIKRDLDEQFQEECLDPLLGPGRARLLYCTRTSANLATYAWTQVFSRPTKITTAIVAAIAVLKKLGITGSIAAALKRIGVPWL